MKKVVSALFILLIIAAVAYLILFRPSSLSEDYLIKKFEPHKAELTAAADYLTNNGISAEITGLLSVDNDYGVPKKGEDEFKKFNNSIEKLMAIDCYKIVSDGKTAKFFFEDTGGLLMKQDGVILYSKNEENKTSLGEKGWYVYTEKKTK